ncbi:ABC transporter ATP-binding protein [Bacillus thermotolerans]|uniref:ABC transporter ATP-binding protein n=1 Tax=Bacillus thermotolerans TaxID=1221996 RepID=UPI0005801A16|nr:ABC transporter ATP-binding protein [Bacillus thermotolerans]KKB35213.1 Vitamin B12 ABC transporter, ATPase component BtuD [Bacillus thermotolerans]
MNISVKNVTSCIGGREILKDIELRVHSGEFVGIIGPNGSGKSTLLKNIYRVLKPDAGVIELEGKDIFKLPSRKVAQNVAVVSQDTPSLFDFDVAEIVSMGRTPHKKFLEADSRKDRDIVYECLEKVGMAKYVHTTFSSLSGGEKQRVMIARALAQEAKVLVLDEPTNHLDIHHQLQILNLARELNVTVAAALHDLNIAAYYCDFIYVMNQGEIVEAGKPLDVLTKGMLRRVFQVEADVMIHPVTNKVHITYLPDGLVSRPELAASR